MATLFRKIELVGTVLVMVEKIFRKIGMVGKYCCAKHILENRNGQNIVQ